MNKIKACIFDLDGVIVDTAKYHFKAWRRLANELGFDFTEEENEQLKGVSRTESLNLILHWGGKSDYPETDRPALAEMKNDWYLEYIERMQSDEILPGIENFLKDLKLKNIKIALGSASKNSELILHKIGLHDQFDVIIDGNKTTKSKPDPEVFLLGAEGLGLKPKECIVFEDAEKGVDAALAGGFYAVGVGAPDVLDHAHTVIPSFEYIDFEEVVETLSNAAGNLK